MKYLKDLNQSDIIDLYNQGYSDTQIARKLDTTSGVIYNFRKVRKLPSNKGNKVLKKSKLFWELCRKKTPVKEIAKALEVSEWCIYDFLHKNNIGLRNFKRPKYKIGKRERSIIVGILLGDGTIYLPDGKTTDARMMIRHGKKQKEYSKYIFECFRSLNVRISTVKLKGHILNGKEIKPSRQIEVTLGAHEFLTELRNAFYPNGKKIINFDYLSKYYNPEALAFHFMDDGSAIFSDGKVESFVLCTDCFSKNEVIKLAGFIEGRFGLNCTVHDSNSGPRIRIKKSSVNRFIQIIKPYICDSLLYKIGLSKIS